MRSVKATGPSRVAAVVLTLLATTASAQDAGPPAATKKAARPTWSFSPTISAYVVPKATNFLNPVVAADCGWLHLEGRYNSAALDTGSFFVGWNFHFGDAWSLDVTPIFGGIVGAIDGFSPGYELTLGWKRFQLYSTGQYLVAVNDPSESYLYYWSQLTYSPLKWLQAGLVVERTRAYTTGLDLQRGFLLGFSLKNVSLTIDVFNLGWEDPTTVLTVGVDF